MRNLFVIDLGYKDDPTTLELLFPREKRAMLLNKKGASLNDVYDKLDEVGADRKKDTILMDRSTPMAEQNLRTMGYNVITVRASI